VTAATTPLRAELVQEAMAEEWDEFVGRQTGAAIYHRYAWRSVFSKVFGRQTYYIATRNSAGAIQGVLPLTRLKSSLFGDFLVSLPYFNYGGAIAVSPAAYAALFEYCQSLAEQLGVRHAELRHRADHVPHWPSRQDKVTLVLPLPNSVAVLNKQLGAKVRSQIKRPTRDGAVATMGGAELLDDFHAVLARNMRDLGTPSYPLAFFAEIMRICGDTARIAIVRLDGRAVAAGLVICHGDTMEIPWASSLREVNRSGVNMLLYATVIEHAVELGLAHFDFGRCTRDSGTFRFKRQWGAEPQQLYWHYWLKSGAELPQLNPQNPKYALAVAAWKRLPVPVASWLSSRLIGNLP